MATTNFARCPAASTSSYSCLSMSTSCGGVGLLNDDSANSRVEFLKKRFAGLITKAQKTLGEKQSKENGNNNVAVADRGMRNEMVKREGNKLKRRDLEIALNGSKKKCEDVDVNVAVAATADGIRKRRNYETELERKNKRRKMEIQRMREEARKEIEQMRNTSGICDPQEVMREFEKLIGYKSVMGHTIWPDACSFIFSKDECEDKRSVRGSNYCDGSQEVEEGEIVD